LAGIRTREIAVGVVVTLALGACGSGGSGGSAGAGRTERERDSVIGQSKLPGARGVQGALGASDSARTRHAALDSIDPDR
jgi:hypothetical protein